MMQKSVNYYELLKYTKLRGGGGQSKPKRYYVYYGTDGKVYGGTDNKVYASKKGAR